MNSCFVMEAHNNVHMMIEKRVKKILTLTNTVFLVPVELLSRRTHTLITALCVHAAILTASVINAALINICNTHERTHTHMNSAYKHRSR